MMYLLLLHLIRLCGAIAIGFWKAVWENTGMAGEHVKDDV